MRASKAQETKIAAINSETMSQRSMTAHEGEQGWALLGLILALSIMAIVLASAVVPNVQTYVRREKEAEMIYRGEQMARAIARYYNQGRLQGIQLFAPPVYGYLTDLKKLREGVTVGVNEIKFVRASATLDPMVNEEWEPVYVRDPRIARFLNNYAAATGAVISDQYWLLAGPPQKLQLNPGFSSTPPPRQGAPSGATPGQTQPGQTQPGQPTPRPPNPETDQDNDSDSDDDDDEDVDDPLGHFFKDDDSTEKKNLPIIGVAPRLKGRAIKDYYGLEYYQDWIFLFVPDPRTMGPQRPPNAIPNQRQNNPRRALP